MGRWGGGGGGDGGDGGGRRPKMIITDRLAPFGLCSAVVMAIVIIQASSYSTRSVYYNIYYTLVLLLCKKYPIIEFSTAVTSIL